MQLILGQYELRVSNISADHFIGEIFHWKRNSQGGNNITPVGYVIMTSDTGDDTFLPHKRIQLFLRSDVRYDTTTQDTYVVANIERQAGNNRSMLKKLKKIRDSKHIYYHEKLPEQIIEHIVSEGMCSEPLGMNICHFEYSGYGERGQLWYDD